MRLVYPPAQVKDDDGVVHARAKGRMEKQESAIQECFFVDGSVHTDASNVEVGMYTVGC
jgi:hypothetical protein